jgi:hypothetical protein
LLHFVEEYNLVADSSPQDFFMNVFEALICNQYAELKLKGKGPSAKINGVMLIALSWLLYFISFLFLLNLLGFDAFKAISRHGLSGRSTGKLLGALLLAVFYALVHFLYGRQQKFDAIIQQFDSLSEMEQKAVSKKGLYYFLGSFGVFAVVFVVFLIKK